MQNARHLIEHLLAKGKLEAAIEGSLILARHYSDQERSNISAQQSARYHTLLTDVNAGTLNDEDYRLERARINRAMLDLAQSMPVDWTDEALKQANFSAKAFDNVPAHHKKSFLEKWGLVLGLVASLMGILGVTMKDILFPKKEDKVAQTAEPKSGSTVPEQTAQPTIKESPKTVESTPKTATNKPVTKPDKVPESSQKPAKAEASSMATPDNKFRSFAKSKIVDDMERGKIGDKMAFRNVRMGKILCCYADAEDFSGGKAFVTEDMVQYYYIDTMGNKVK